MAFFLLSVDVKALQAERTASLLIVAYAVGTAGWWLCAKVGFIFCVLLPRLVSSCIGISSCSQGPTAMSSYSARSPVALAEASGGQVFVRSCVASVRDALRDLPLFHKRCQGLTPDENHTSVA